MKTLTTTLLFVLINSFAFATVEKKQIKIRITAPGVLVDETTVYFDLGISSAYASTEDAPKVFSNIPNVPSIYSISTDNVFCSTNGYSELSTSEIVPLGVRTDTSGTYLFTATLLNNFDATSIIQLEDRVTNSFTDLRLNTYSVQLVDSENTTGRFFLHVSHPIQFSSVAAGCANNDGVLQINQDNAVLWTSSNLFDSIGNTAGNFSNISGTYSFNNLAEGDYNLVMNFGNYMTSKLLHVNGSYIVTHIQPSSFTASVNEEIIFRTTTHNGTIYQWDLGDGAQIGGVANPYYAYAEPGIYKVVVISTNAAGCSYSDSVTVTISAATAVNEISNTTRNVYAFAKTITVVLNEEIKQGAELKVYNLLGQPVYNNSVTASTTLIALNVEPTGYYIVSIQNNNSISTKRVFIGK